MLVEFLSDEEAARFGRYVKEGRLKQAPMFALLLLCAGGTGG
ncbi:MAG TPA: hypothetical protein VK988_14230 [Acidimicrobiales bacterium]|nr:hypothetical protein [Acidimicrobiales bacterium]